MTNGRSPAFRGLEISPRDLLERSLLQFSIGQKPFERGVLAFEVFEPFGVLGLQAAELVAPAVLRRLRDSQLRAHAAVSFPSASNRSAAINLRTTCSAVCRFLVVMILSSLPGHNVGRKTLICPGSTNRGQANLTNQIPQNAALGGRAQLGVAVAGSPPGTRLRAFA